MSFLDEDVEPETKKPCLLCEAKPSARWRCPDCAGTGLVTVTMHSMQKLQWPEPPPEAA